MMITKENFINSLIGQLNISNLSVFLGAGFSIDAGLPSWKNLVEPLVKEYNFCVSNETNYYKILQYLQNNLGPIVLKDKIYEQLSKLPTNLPCLSAALELPIDSFWTVNFDDLLERELEKKFKVRIDPICKDSDLAKIQHDLNKIKHKVFKMNGTITDRDSWILTESDLEDYVDKNIGMLTFFRRELVQNTFLILGYSFTDTLLLFALRDVKKYFDNKYIPHHFTILKKDTENIIKFEWFVYDLEKRYGIKTLVVDSYDEIPIILNEITKRIRKKQVYFSGAFRKISEQEEEFGMDLSKQLTNKLLDAGYNIYTGMGRRLGDLIAGSACRWIYEHNQVLTKRIIIKPDDFDRYGGKRFGANSKTKEMRENISQGTGIAIFMYGQSSTDPHGSSGTYQEFEIAKEKYQYIIPIGVTGYESRKIWKEVKNNITLYGYLEKYIDKLNDSSMSPNEVSNIVMQIISEIQYN